jgi:hypothetical protein
MPCGRRHAMWTACASATVQNQDACSVYCTDLAARDFLM